MRVEYINVNSNKLHDELISATITPILVESLDNKTWITFEDGTDMELVQQIIDTHDSTPLPALPTLEELLEIKIAENAVEMLGLMLTLGELKKLEQAQSNTEMIELMIMLGGM